MKRIRFFCTVALFLSVALLNAAVPAVKGSRKNLKLGFVLQGEYAFAGGAAADRSLKNAFPLASAHPVYGAGMVLDTGRKLFFRSELLILFSGPTIFTDPSDGDTFKSSPRFFSQLNLLAGFAISRGERSTLLCEVGGGTVFQPKIPTVKVQSSLGNQVAVTYPTRFGFAVLAGPRWHCSGNRFDFDLSLRYSLRRVYRFHSAVVLQLGGSWHK